MISKQIKIGPEDVGRKVRVRNDGVALITGYRTYCNYPVIAGSNTYTKEGEQKRGVYGDEDIVAFLDEEPTEGENQDPYPQPGYVYYSEEDYTYFLLMIVPNPTSGETAYQAIALDGQTVWRQPFLHPSNAVKGLQFVAEKLLPEHLKD